MRAPSHSVSTETFTRFLAWLSPDVEEAGRRYNDIHRALSRIFASRGCDRPDDLADQTLDRVIRKVDLVAPGYEGNPAAYVHGVAKKVFLEYIRSRQRFSEATLPDLGTTLLGRESAATDPALEHRYACLERCLQELSTAERALILQYYQGERWAKIEGRQVLADETQLSGAALRKRTQRIRLRLKNCLMKCMAESSGRKA
jgi:DNA-directed RNA polymerase specialized sigma24 family protein